VRYIIVKKIVDI